MTTGLTNLKDLERNAFRRFNEDGLFDVYVGSMLILMGIVAVFADRLRSESVGMLTMLGAAAAITFPLLYWRRHLLRNRLGAFEPGPDRRRKLRGTRLVLLASVVVGVIAFGLTAVGNRESIEMTGLLVSLLWFGNAVVVFGAMAYFLDVPRFYFHGVIIGLAMPIMIWPDIMWERQVEPWIALGIPGSIVAAVGASQLRTFLRNYPALPTDEAVDERG